MNIRTHASSVEAVTLLMIGLTGSLALSAPIADFGAERVRQESPASADLAEGDTTQWGAKSTYASMINRTASADALVGAGACTDDADCADEDPCSLGSCVENSCVYVPECVADEECDDNNVCTIDECIGGCCETRPQCFANTDCGENERCEYNCCIRCPSCLDVRGLWTRCRRGRLSVVVLLRDDRCNGNTLMLDVAGRAVECDVRGRLAVCSTKGTRGPNTVCIAEPDCPDRCQEVTCSGR